MKGLGWVAVAAVAAYFLLRPRPVVAMKTATGAGGTSTGGVGGAIGAIVDGGVKLYQAFAGGGGESAPEPQLLNVY